MGSINLVNLKSYCRWLLIRKFNWEDLPAIVDLEARSFEVGAYSMEELTAVFSNPSSFNYLAEENGKIVGYIVAIPLDNSSADIESIAVDPTVQRGGVGSMLMEYIEEEMLARGYSVSILEVREKNLEAIAFYQKHGYEKTKLLSNYYREHFRESRHGFRMAKRLKQNE